jgi:hypothetical protein
MLVTYKIQGRRAGEDLPAITLSSSHGMAGVVESYERRAGRLTAITVELLDDVDEKKRQSGESE